MPSQLFGTGKLDTYRLGALGEPNVYSRITSHLMSARYAACKCK